MKIYALALKAPRKYNYSLYNACFQKAGSKKNAQNPIIPPPSGDGGIT